MAEELMIFGVRPVIEAIDAGKVIDKVLLKKGIESFVIDTLTKKCKDAGVTIQYVPHEKLNRLTKGNHQGVIAQLAAIEYSDIIDIIDNISTKPNGLIVVLDSITDVRNFGAISRSAECAGVDALIVSLKSSAPVNSEAIKSSAGALTVIPVCRVGSIRNTLKMLSQSGMQIVAADEKSETPIFQSNLTKPTVIVMGSEDTGISKEVLKMCDNTYRIPMQGKIESLNVSAAAAVILFEAVRQRTLE